MSNKLIKKRPNEITMTVQQLENIKRDMKRKITDELFEEIQTKATSMQAQALMLSFGLALYQKYGIEQEEIFKVLDLTDQNMGDFLNLEDLEKFRDYVNKTCGFDIRIPGYADEEKVK